MRKSELTAFRWRDVDRESRELIVRSSVVKNHTERRLPIDDGLWVILERRREEKRQPGSGKTPAITARVQELFTRERVFTTSESTPLTHRHAIYGAFVRCCRLAQIEQRTLDENGREIEHVDIHSLRRTFATDLISNGADPKTVQELMGHKSLAMTMNLYAKIHTSTRRQAVGRLSFGKGATQPEHMVSVSLPLAQPTTKAHKISTTGLPARVASP